LSLAKDAVGLSTGEDKARERSVDYGCGLGEASSRVGYSQSGEASSERFGSSLNDGNNRRGFMCIAKYAHLERHCF
jgi:hypothetical protein